MFRPTINDMQDEYCGNCYDIYLIQSRYKGNHKRGNLCILAFNKVNIVAVTTIRVLHVGNGWSEHVRLDIMFLAMTFIWFADS